MRRVLPYLFAVGATLVSCRAAENISAPNDQRLQTAGPSKDVEGMNCNMDQWKCDVIRAGIDYLLNHANETCRNVGQVALDRFEAPASTGNGYEDAAQASNYYMGVVMVPGNSYSGAVTTSGHVEVYPNFWNSPITDPQHTGSYLAHEEQHQNGMDAPDHHTGYGYGYQEACYNTSA